MKRLKYLTKLSSRIILNIIVFLACLLTISTIQDVKSQNLYNYSWLFGSNGGNLTFNIENKGYMYENLFGNTSTYGDKQSLTAVHASTGALLFYSDGRSIFNANHANMPNGTGLNGLQTKLYSISGIQSPFNENHFLVFYANASNVSMSVVDINVSGGGVSNSPSLGDVLGSSKNRIISNNVVGDVVLPLYGKNSDNVYVLFQNTVNNMVLVFSVNNQLQFSQVANLQLDFTVSSADFFEVSNSTIKIALGPKEQLKKVTLVDFNLGTGKFVANSQTTVENSSVNNGSTDYAIYSLAFSSTGEHLYYSIRGNNPTALTGNVIKYNLASKLEIPTLTSSLYRSYGLKLGPDDRIYHLYEDISGRGTQMAVYNKPDGVGNNFEHQNNLIPTKTILGTVFPYTAYSKFTPPAATSFSIDMVGNCKDKTIAFSPTYPTTHIPKSISWDFGDGNLSQSLAPIHTYTSAGTFDVKVTLTFPNGDTRIVSRQITIVEDQNVLKLPEDTTLCTGETLTLDAGSASATWNTGVVAQSIVVSKPGTYFAVLGSGGCISYDEIKVKYFSNENRVSNQWVFGTRAGIDFNQNPPVATSSSAMVSPRGGVATISDENGDMLFYTDGETVWAKDHTPMPNGTSIGGQKDSSQSSLIVPFPKDNTLFYIFTTNSVYGNGSYQLSYSIVDLKQNSLKGDVVLKGKTLFVKSTEKITANTVGDVTWLVAHEFGNNIFNSYKITESGISSPIKSNIGLSHSTDDENKGKGYMKLNSNGDKLAITVPGNTGKVQIFDFNTSNGEITNAQTLDTNVNLPSYPYGLEWSNDSMKLFISIVGSRNIQEWEIQDTPSKITDLTSDRNVGALQKGPNGVIYVAKENGDNLDSITVRNGITEASTLNSNAISLATNTTSGLGLPSFVQSLASQQSEPSLNFSQTCANTPTTFTGTGTSDIDTFTWSFGDGATANEQNPMHTYTQAGTYNVQLSITNKCGYINLLTQPVVIENSPNINDETIGLCGSSETLTPGTGLPAGYTYLWTLPNGNTLTNKDIMASTPGDYTVAVTTPRGCTKTVTKSLIDIRPSFELGTDRTLCKDSTFVLDAQNPNATSYVWMKNGVVIAGANTRTLSVDTSIVNTPGISTAYEVTVQIVVNNRTCTKSDTVNITVIDLPTVNIINRNPTSACGVNNGSLEFTIGSAISLFTYSLNVGTNVIKTESNMPGGVARPITINNLSSGSYSLTITNETTQCVYVERHISINDGGGFKAVPQLPIAFTSCRVAKGENIIIFNVTDINDNTLDSFDNIWVDGEQGTAGIQAKVINGNGQELKLGDDFFQENKPNTSTIEIHGLLQGRYSITFTSRITTETTTTTNVNGVSQNIITTPNRPNPCTFNVNIDVSNSAQQLNVQVYSTLDNSTAGAVSCGTIPLSVRFTDGTEVSSDLFKFKWSSLTAQFKGSVNFKSVGAVTKGEHTYKLEVAERNGNRCPNEDDIIATILDSLDFSIQEGDNSSCDGQLVLSAAITNGVAGEQFLYKWQDVKNNNALVGSSQSITIDTTSNTTTQEYSYQLSVVSNLRSNSCISPVTKTVTVQPKFTLTLSNTLACDDGLPYQIIAETNRPSTTVLKYNWKKDGEPFPQSTRSIIVSENGKYEVEVLELKNLSDDIPICRQSSSVDIVMAAIPRIVLPLSYTICPLSTDISTNQVVLDQKIPDGFASYRWIKDGIEISQSKSLTISGGDAAGSYRFEAKTVFGCIARAGFTVIVDCRPKVYVPTAFTPDKNNLNEMFSIKSTFVTDFTISIFNQWGETIFKSNDKNFRWDGRFKNELIPTGAYSYVMEYLSAYDNSKTKYTEQGGVMILY